MRLGYAIAHPDTLALIRAQASSGTLSSVTAGAGLASIEEPAHLAKMKELNRQARVFTVKAFEKAGYTVLPSEANFIMVDVRRESTEYTALCREAGVSIARPFPPFTKHARITIGTVDEMKKAVALMVPLLSAPAKAATPTSTSSGRIEGAFELEHETYC
ncbi:MAG TPA: aminotransferase class I/II-fold pyridoxal phosphate-dependent enzyme, partial [Rhizomicrobium sp.]